MNALSLHRRQVQVCRQQWRQHSREFGWRRAACARRLTRWMQAAPWALAGLCLGSRLLRSRAGSEQDPQPCASGRETRQASGAPSPAANRRQQLSAWLNLFAAALRAYSSLALTVAAHTAKAPMHAEKRGSGESGGPDV